MDALAKAFAAPAQGIVTRKGRDSQEARGEAQEPGPAEPDAPSSKPLSPLACRQLQNIPAFCVMTDEREGPYGPPPVEG